MIWGITLQEKKIQNKEVSVEHINTSKMIADIFTKALPGPRFEYLRESD